jgi:hypothetical protein
MTDTDKVLCEVADERGRQDAKWGKQNDHPDGTGTQSARASTALIRDAYQQAFARGAGTWSLILAEEIAEAFAESDRAKLRTELIQVAAVAVAWIEAIDRRATRRGGRTPPAGTPICNECWIHDCKNCTGRNCWHAERDEHYVEDDEDEATDGDTP